MQAFVLKATFQYKDIPGLLSETDTSLNEWSGIHRPEDTVLFQWDKLELISKKIGDGQIRGL